MERSKGEFMKKTWRRRNYFIKKDLQGKYIFSFFLFVIAGGVIFTLIFSMLSANTLSIAYENYNLRIGKTPIILLKEILSANWIFIVAAGLSVVVLSMFLTHRFAGPMFRFEKSVEEMMRGNFNFQIRLRKKDEGKELAKMINELADMVSSNVSEMRRLSDKIGTVLTDARESISETKGNREADQKINEANALNGKLREILGYFKTKNNE
jgi:methyl-accepting chemotaxis protein